MSNINTYAKVAIAAKEAARDAIRSEKVLALQGYIATQEKRIKDLNDSVAPYEDDVIIARNDLALLPDGDPRIAKREEVLKHCEEALKRQKELVDEGVKACSEKVAEYKDKISKWENGESLVDRALMEARASAYVQNAFGEQFAKAVADAVVGPVETTPTA